MLLLKSLGLRLMKNWVDLNLQKIFYMRLILIEVSLYVYRNLINSILNRVYYLHSSKNPLGHFTLYDEIQPLQNDKNPF